MPSCISRNCAQIFAQDLAHVRLRQCFEEASPPGPLVRREFTPTVRDHFGFGHSRALGLSDEQPHRLAGLLIRATDTGAFRDAGTGRGDCFDLVWIDVEARDDDHVLLAVYDLEEPPLVEHANVAGPERAI